MKVFERFSSVLSLPAVYRVFSRVVGARGAWLTHLGAYVKPRSGEKVLDIGCGPADVLTFLPEVDYLGMDISPEYIAAAEKRFGSKGRFMCGDVGLATIEREHGTFNLVMATGVVHHLDDERASRLFSLARHALAAGGRLITYDGCYAPNQARIARWMLSNDRGKFVRTSPEYLRLASPHFQHVESHLRHDLLRVPYTHLIMRCSD